MFPTESCQAGAGITAIAYQDEFSLRKPVDQHGDELAGLRPRGLLPPPFLLMERFRSVQGAEQPVKVAPVTGGQRPDDPEHRRHRALPQRQDGPEPQEDRPLERGPCQRSTQGRRRRSRRLEHTPPIGFLSASWILPQRRYREESDFLKAVIMIRYQSLALMDQLCRAVCGSKQSVKVRLTLPWSLTELWPCECGVKKSQWPCGKHAWLLAILKLRPAGVEPTTVRLEGGCSVQLSYGRFAYHYPNPAAPEPKRACKKRAFRFHIVSLLCGAERHEQDAPFSVQV